MKRLMSLQSAKSSQTLLLKGTPMLGTIILVILILLLVGALPNWPHSASWGYGPSGTLGTVLIVILILVLLGKI